MGLDGLIMLGFLALCVYDATLVAAFVVNLCRTCLGETPVSRLLRVLGGFAAFFLYGYWASYETVECLMGDSKDAKPLRMIIPLAIPLVIKFIVYIMKGGDNKNGDS